MRILTAVLACWAGVVAVPSSAIVSIDPAARPPTNRKAVELIHRLTNVSERTVGAHDTAAAIGFMPSDEHPRMRRGILGAVRPVYHPAMTGLAEMGVDALPDLLNHLTDDRKTRLVVGHERGFGGNWFGDEYDPRNGPPRSTLDDLENHFVGSYTVRVGDLCYVIIGQIVNRELHAVRYQPSSCVVVNSPVEHPKLAETVRRDWEGLTREEHRQLLIEESRGRSWRAESALIRLRFYYPDAVP